MNGKIYGGWVALPMLIFSVANGFFFYTQLFKNHPVSSIIPQSKDLSHWQIAARNDDAYQCLQRGDCRSF
jgi:hypothetical protein